LPTSWQLVRLVDGGLNAAKKEPHVMVYTATLLKTFVMPYVHSMAVRDN